MNLTLIIKWDRRSPKLQRGDVCANEKKCCASSCCSTRNVPKTKWVIFGNKSKAYNELYTFLFKRNFTKNFFCCMVNYNKKGYAQNLPELNIKDVAWPQIQIIIIWMRAKSFRIFHYYAIPSFLRLGKYITFFVALHLYNKVEKYEAEENSNKSPNC